MRIKFNSLVRVTIIPLVVTSLLACDSDTTSLAESSSPTGVAGILNTNRMDHRAAVRMASAVSGATGSQLLSNRDFTDQANSWISCNGDPIATTVSDGQTEALVGTGNCIQQGVSVTPDDILVLQCDAALASVRGSSWTGVGLSFYDDNWNFISEPTPALVTGNSTFGTWQVSGTVPQGASRAAVWIYSEIGARVRSCDLTVSDGEPSRPPSLPTLANGNFDEISNGKPVGWTDYCGGAVESVGSGNPIGDVRVGNGACLTQSLNASVVSGLRGQDFVFACSIFTNSGAYGEISTNLPGAHTAERIVNGSSGTIKVSGTAANDIDNAYVSLYYEGDPGQYVLDCWLSLGTDSNQRPLAADDYLEFPSVSSAIDIADLRVTANDSDADGQLNFQTLRIIQAPGLGTALVRQGKISYSSAVRSDDSFKYVIADDRNKVSREATVVISYTNTNNNLAPIALNDEIVITPGYQPPIPVKENDYDPDGAFTSSPQITRAPRHGTAVLNANGETIDYEYSRDGATSDSFEYLITDVAGATDTALVTIGIAPQYRNQARVVRSGMINPVIDGEISEFEYENAEAARRPVNGIASSDSFDGTRDRYRFSGLRIGHDDQYLYIATSMNKFVESDSYTADGSLWEDDSFEIFFDLGNEGTAGYDSNDFVRIFGFGKNTPDTVTGINSRAALSHEARCTGGDTNNHTCEVRFDLAEMGLSGPGDRTFGFDIQWNLDADGGDREVKYSWCAESGDNFSTIIDAWRDISTVDCTITLTD